MEYSLQAIYYLIRGYVNLLLQMEVANGVTIGGITFSVMLLSGLFVALGLIYKPDAGLPNQLRLTDKRK